MLNAAHDDIFLKDNAERTRLLAGMPPRPTDREMLKAYNHRLEALAEPELSRNITMWVENHAVNNEFSR
jgi:hypothetical protein